MGLSREERREYDRLRDIPDDNDDGGYEEDVLNGRTTAAISHAGEPLTPENVQRADEDLLEGLRENHRYVAAENVFSLLIFSASSNLGGRYTDTRTRRDRTQKQVNAFAAQMAYMTDAYLDWSLSIAQGGLDSRYELPQGAVVEGRHVVMVVDMFCTSVLSVHWPLC